MSTHKVCLNKIQRLYFTDPPELCSRRPLKFCWFLKKNLMRLNNSCKLLTKYKTLFFFKLKKDKQICCLLLSGIAVYELRTSFERCKKTRIPRSAVYRKYCIHYNSAYF